MITSLCKVLEIEFDSGNYITYVFKNLETESILDKYIMCTQFPNWQHRILNVGEVGYLTYEQHLAGIDKWFDGQSLHYYNYNCIQFIKFIDKKPNKTNTIIL